MVSCLGPRLMPGPPRTEVRIAKPQFTDQGSRRGVVRGTAGFHSQHADALGGGAGPVRVQSAERNVEEGQSDQVALGRRQCAEVGQNFFDFRGLAANGALARTYPRQALTLLGVYSVLYGMTRWTQTAHGMSTVAAGHLLLPMGAVSALLARPLAKRNLVRGPLIASAVTMLVGSVGIMLFTSGRPAISIVLGPWFSASRPPRPR